MSYSPKSWNAGDTITHDALNNLEGGLQAAATTADAGLAAASSAQQSAATNANTLAGKADQASLDSLSTTVSSLSQSVTTVQSTTATTGYVDNAVSGLATTAYVQAQVAGVAPAYANLPAGTQIVVLKAGGSWPVRPTSRTDIVVAWKGADPSPAIGGTGMVSGVDIRYVTP